MGKYVLKRVILAIITLFVIMSLTFILIKLLPFQKPIGQVGEQFAYYQNQVKLGFVARFDQPAEGYGELLFHYQYSSYDYYFYQVPVMQQYFSWIKNILTAWDWGTSTYISPNVDAMVIIEIGELVMNLLLLLKVVEN